MKFKYLKPSKRSELTKAQTMNQLTFNAYLERLQRVAMSIFTWENLPDGMNERWLEYCLYLYGCASMLKDPILGYMNLQATTADNLNNYHLPVRIRCYGLNYNDERGNRLTFFGGKTPENPDNYAVLALNNEDMTPTMLLMNQFATRLTEVQRTIDVNLKLHKMPFVLQMDDKQRLTFENLFKQIDTNVAMVMGNKNTLNLEDITAIKTDVPYIIDKLENYKTDIWNEALTTLGINNLRDKRERLVADEVGTNNEVINLNLQSYLIPRQRAARQFNKLYGTDIKVKLRSDLKNILKNTESIYPDEITETTNIDDYETEDKN